MLAFRIAAAQNFLMSVRCSPATLPGKRYWLPEFSWRMLATRLAAGALSGRCSVRLCLVWWEGLIQTPRFRSKSAFRLETHVRSGTLEHAGIRLLFLTLRLPAESSHGPPEAHQDRCGGPEAESGRARGVGQRPARLRPPDQAHRHPQLHRPVPNPRHWSVEAHDDRAARSAVDVRPGEKAGQSLPHGRRPRA